MPLAGALMPCLISLECVTPLDDSGGDFAWVTA